MRHPLSLLILASGVSFLPYSTQAQWIADGVAVSTAANDQAIPVIDSDGAGGVIVAWQDFRNGSSEIYAQKLDTWGVPQWTVDGVPLLTATGATGPAIVSDGAGGAIVAWSAIDIYAQRVNASGVPQWSPGGVALATAGDHQDFPMIVSDGAGGAVVTFQVNTGGALDIYAQRVSNLGVPLWAAAGVVISAAVNIQRNPMIVSDGAAGAIVTWWDLRSGEYDIYAQRVNDLGVPQWPADGVALCTATNQQSNPTIASDGAGGAIVAWEDYRNVVPADQADIYARRVNAAGTPQWATNGVAMCAAANHQDMPKITLDGAGGAIVTWRDFRFGPGDIYVQRTDASGVPQWTGNGVVICSAANVQSIPTIASDGAAGAVVAWQDFRSGTPDIYARRVDASGVPQWTNNGVALCTAASTQNFPRIASDGASGAIVTWQDLRSGGNDVYAQRVDASGDIPTAVSGSTRGPSLVVTGVYPNPFAGMASMDIELTTPSAVEIEVFDVAGRIVRSMSLSDAVSQRVEFDGRDGANHLLPSGVYFYRVKAAGETITRKMVIAR